MKFRRDREYAKKVTCPRCGLKSYEGIDECPDCGLVFSRLELATNKEAKAKKLRGDRDFIVNTTKIPSDVSYIKLLLLCIFLGPFGAHNFYVGKYLRGSVLLTDFFVVLMLVIFNQSLMTIHDGKFIGALSIVCGFIMMIWFWDLLMIITKKFKVPVAIDIEGELLKQKNEYMDSLKELDGEKEIVLETKEEKQNENKDGENK